ncbi:hypothetical protein [Roseospira visakhapatnamensis]|uniref:Uncharacterized protein n=1 Tax=Roseospira visakhapatnamensis TaxID=390880 RepID=A0A7W6RGV4_9PROT|nr:hypothetical protein [Roseospira visakhapatnamensis]MBB4267794.1 hypothetical protein [Roseospira visakhapatnamensis]
MSAMTPKRDLVLDGQAARTIAVVTRPHDLVLVVLTADGRHHVCDQGRDGTVTHRAGPFDPQEALQSVIRILAGREMSVTSDTLAVAVGLLATTVGEDAS